MRGGPQRPGGGGGQPRHRAGRGGRGGALGRPEPSGGMSVTRLEIISDPVCPWCYLGRGEPDAGGRGAREAHPFAIRWRPYQLDPTLPPEGIDRAAYMAAKFGDAAAARARACADRGDGRGEAGITFRLRPHRPGAEHARRAPGDPLGGSRRGCRPARRWRCSAATSSSARTSPTRACSRAAAAEAGLDGAAVGALLAGDADREEVARRGRGGARDGGDRGADLHPRRPLRAARAPSRPEVWEEVIGRIEAAAPAG